MNSGMILKTFTHAGFQVPFNNKVGKSMDENLEKVVIIVVKK